jgi:NAD(P)-dependent dehydrogenase (short-subunit alcohol dehydrogenase family)
MLKGKTVLVTGGCSGIGEATVERALEEEAEKVIVIDRCLGTKLDPRIKYYVADVASKEEMSTIFKNIDDTLDCACNCAGKVFSAL